MIPRIFHQIFISCPKLPVPPKICKKYIKKLKKLHPHWEYHYWDTNTLHSFIHTQYPAFSEYFSHAIPPVIQSDIGRYLILQYYGGWYLDLDYEFLRPIDVWNDKKNIVLPLSNDGTENGREISFAFGNAIIGSAPQQTLWSSMLESLPPPDFFTADISSHTVFTTTGPSRLTKIYATLSAEEQAEILTPSKIHFHYTIPLMMSFSDYRKIKKNKEIFGIHHTYSSWIDKNVHKNITRRQFAKNIFIRPFFLYYHKRLQNLKKTRKQ